MNEIHVLSKEISELIAAGEVIEKPASVVKELIENSVDAGAKHITVEIKNGGKTFIRISDDGCGIAENQVETAFMRHATSKIETKEDLDKIFTLGFRGEALASVSAVSKVDIVTKQANEEYGTHYVAEGGVPLIFEKVGCSSGTTIIIKDLFFNVPARQKFLKKDVTEGNAIGIIVNKIALSHPEISFRFIRDGKAELNSVGDGELYSAIYSVYGKTFANDMIKVDYEENDIRVQGYVVKPLYSKANRSFQNFFINSRYIKSATCSVALEEAYKGVIMVGKFPASILNISLIPSIVDVNVHPSKAEVRFSDDKIIFNTIYFAVKNALMQNGLIYEFQLENSQTTEKKSETQDKEVAEQKGSGEIAGMKSNSDDLVTDKPIHQNSIPINKQVKKVLPIADECLNDKGEDTGNKQIPIEDSITSFTNKKSIIEKLQAAENVKIDKAEVKEFQFIDADALTNKNTETLTTLLNDNDKRSITVIGEIFYNYILAEVDNSMVMIDKHAGHERILYEQLKGQSKKVESQLVMNIGGILLSENEFQALEENIPLLDNMGFKFDYSKKPYIVPKAIPIFLSDENMDEVIAELAENIYLNKINPQTHCLDDMFHSLACKAAIKANDKNSKEELQSLAEQVYFNENIRHCPHGRPVMFILTKKDIEKQFKRIQ